MDKIAELSRELGKQDAEIKRLRELGDLGELDEVIGKLSAAALQLSSKDDQIIGDHIRDSVALLLQYRHKIRGDI